MNGKKLINLETPTTQRPDAVAALATYLNRTIEGGVLDLGSLKLVKSNKGDAFYGVTAKKCSCPSSAYRPGAACKHQRKYFPVAMGRPSTTSEPLVKRGGFKPVDALPSEEKARAAPLYVDMHDTTLRDVAYHSIKEDREMWPAEA